MSLGRHTLANLAGAVVPMVITLVTVPLYLHYVGAERYGVLAIIWALLGYFGFFNLGLGSALTQRMSRQTEATAPERSALLWTALITSAVLGMIGGVALWQGADYLLSHLVEMEDQYRQEAGSAVGWLMLALPILLPASVLDGALRARLRFFDVNVIGVLGNVLGQLLPLTVAASGHARLEMLVPAALAPSLITTALLVVQARRHVPLHLVPAFDLVHLKSMLGYGGWVSVIGILAPLLVTIDRLVIAAMSGAKAVTYYTVPYNLVTRGTLVAGSLAGALFPRLAAAGEDEAMVLARRATRLLVAVMTPLVIAGLVLLAPFLELWLGSEMARESALVGEILLLGVWVNTIVYAYHARIMATKNPRTLVLLYLAELPLYFLMLWFGLKQWGVAGAAVAWSARVTIDTLALFYLSHALGDALREIAVASALLLAVASIVFMSGGNFPLIAGVGGLVLVATLARDWPQFTNAYASLRRKNVQ